MTRGIKPNVDHFINDCLAQYFPYKHLNPITKKIENKWLQLGARPIQLWEFAFPREALKDVVAMIEPSDGIPGAVSQNALRKVMGFIVNRLRKLLKLKPIPKIDPKHPKRIVFHQNIGIYALGYSEDEDKILKTKIEQV